MFQIDRTKKPTARVSADPDPKPDQNGQARDVDPSSPSVPNRLAKPPLQPGSSQPEDRHSDRAAAEKEASEQGHGSQEERRDGDNGSKDTLEREQGGTGRKEEEDKMHQDRKRLERQKAKEEVEEEGEKVNGAGVEKERKGRELGSDTPGKSASLDSPAPNHLVSEIKVSPFIRDFKLQARYYSKFPLQYRNICVCVCVCVCVCARARLPQREPLTRARSEEMGRSIPGLPIGWMKVPEVKR